MASLERKSLKSPDETRTFDKGQFGLVHVGDVTVGLYEFEPGWRWSESVKPLVGTDSCQNHHIGYVISGQLGTRLDDGTEQEFGPGDVYVIPPGHDGWVITGYTPLRVDHDVNCHTCGTEHHEGNILFKPVFEKGNSPKAIEHIPSEEWVECTMCVENSN